jgi:DNA-binding GntR family transcriptional regulator
MCSNIRSSRSSSLLSSFVTEGAIIEKLALGRTPVREAIQRLAWEGLLEVRPRAGIAIAPLHPGDWLRVLDARRGVEIVLARSAARFVTREAADMFHDAALAMQKAVISGNVLAFIQADKALDEALAMAADNPTSPLGSPRRCRPTAAASGSATRPTPASPNRPNTTSR